ncbi:LemA family protein [Thorsellia kenyensis]|uniref:LemA family protein n=1 Tax=Thorsellia kenyensis TaxID=1549888 RepID=A0ABV6C825_9GAMM
MKKILAIVILFLMIFSIVLIKQYNSIQKKHEAVNASFSEVFNQYQRRYDLIPNLVNTVKSYTIYEKEVLENVIKARSSVGKININADQIDDPKLVIKYQNAQNELSSSITKLLAISEQYPDLKASSLYQDLMVQLEGTENRISVARSRQIETINQYNAQLREFPAIIIASYMDYQPINQIPPSNDSKIAVVPKVEL